MNSNKKMNKGRAQDITQPCNTVGAHLAKVSLNSTDPVLCLNNRYRRFTPREVARIQSFPDSFELVGSEASQYRALGNAIPPVMFWHLIQEVKKAIS
jgi:DNA (cytosine-5)-methyltransferase 1